VPFYNLGEKKMKFDEYARLVGLGEAVEKLFEQLPTGFFESLSLKQWAEIVMQTDDPRVLAKIESTNFTFEELLRFPFRPFTLSKSLPSDRQHNTLVELLIVKAKSYEDCLDVRRTKSLAGFVETMLQKNLSKNF